METYEGIDNKLQSQKYFPQSMEIELFLHICTWRLVKVRDFSMKLYNTDFVIF